MQMGRWFGFRPGYRDLVRLYIGTKEQKGRRVIDLYEAFGAVCRDEEALRTELQKYAKGDLTPRQVPPLVLQHLPYVPPTSPNKMFNAKIASQDFGGSWTEKTSAPTGAMDQHVNRQLAAALLAASQSLGAQECSVTNEKGVGRSFDAYAGLVSSGNVLEFLRAYRWAESRHDQTPIDLEIEYVEKENKAGRLADWLILAPQAGEDQYVTLKESGFPRLTVIGRTRASETRFGVYSEPRHRDVAQFLAAVGSGTGPSAFLRKYRSPSRPVLVMYLVKELGERSSAVSVGFGIQFPGVKTSKGITWSVNDSARNDEVVVPVRRIRRKNARRDNNRRAGTADS
jgi:hypothetical protein